MCASACGSWLCQLRGAGGRTVITLNEMNGNGFGNEMPSALNAVNRMKCL